MLQPKSYFHGFHVFQIYPDKLLADTHDTLHQSDGGGVSHRVEQSSLTKGMQATRSAVLVVANHTVCLENKATF